MCSKAASIEAYDGMNELLTNYDIVTMSIVTKERARGLTKEKEHP